MNRAHRQPAVIAGASALGAVAGMRSQLPLAILAWAAREGLFAAGANLPLAFLRSSRTLTVSTILATGEFVVDTLPRTPSRLKPGRLAARFLVGGLAGSAVAMNAGNQAATGAFAGVVGACLGAYAGYSIRRALGEAWGIPDPIVAIGEDILAIGIGLAALHKLEQMPG